MIRFSWVIVFATALHFMWGASMLMTPPAGPDAAGGVSWNIYIEMGGAFVWGWAMLFASCLATGAFMTRNTALSILLCLPQQAVLTVGAAGILFNVFGFSEAAFEISRIFRMLPHAVGLFAVHTIVLLEVHGVWNWRERSRRWK